MSPETALIVTALITAGASVLVGMLTSSFKELKESNSRDHGAVRDRLADLKGDIHEIKDGVKSVSNRLDEHVSWHLDHTEKNQ